MTRRKGEQTPRRNELEYPHHAIVEVPAGETLGLLDAGRLCQFLGAPIARGRSRYTSQGEACTFCFASAALADEFARRVRALYPCRRV